MKKINLTIVSALVSIFIPVMFAFAAPPKDGKNPIIINPAPAAEVKKTSPVPVNVKPVATTPIKQAPVVPVTNAVPVVAPAPGQPTPQPAPTSVEAYSYNPTGKPDPFRPFIVVDVAVEKKQGEKKAAAVSIFPLQMAETEKYRVVGIAGDESYRMAIAEDAAKKFYPLFKGTHIGLNNGKVIEIMADRVIVEEYEAKKAKRVILKLRKN